MKGAFPVLLVFTLEAFVQAGPVIRNDLRGLDAIARDHTAQVLEGKGILLPGPEPYAEDRGIVLFGLPDDDWPALFRLGLAGVWDHGFLVYPFSVRTDDETGERLFYNSAESYSGRLYNPASVAATSNGLFKITVEAPSEDPVPDSEIVWRAKDCPSSDLWFENGGQGRVAVAHVSTNEAIRTAEIAITDFVGPNPEIKLQSYADFRTIPVRFAVARGDLNGMFPMGYGSGWFLVTIDEWIEFANQTYEQACVSFSWTNGFISVQSSDLFNLQYDDDATALEAFNIVHDNECISVCIVNQVFRNGVSMESAFSYREDSGQRRFFGIVMPANSLGFALAHELGHGGGLEDYYLEPDFGDVSLSPELAESELFSEHFPKDWTGPKNYYAEWMTYAIVESSILMCGFPLDPHIRDIPLGKVYGIGDVDNGHSRCRLIPVGVEDYNPSQRSSIWP